MIKATSLSSTVTTRPSTLPATRLTFIGGKLCEALAFYTDPATHEAVEVPEDGLDSLPKYSHLGAKFLAAPAGSFIQSQGSSYQLDYVQEKWVVLPGNTSSTTSTGELSRHAQEISWDEDNNSHAESSSAADEESDA